MLGHGLVAFALSLVEMLDQADPTIRQRLEWQVFLPGPKGLAYTVQE
jgi:hypothetical protein